MGVCILAKDLLRVSSVGTAAEANNPRRLAVKVVFHPVIRTAQRTENLFVRSWVAQHLNVQAFRVVSDGVW